MTEAKESVPMLRGTNGVVTICPILLGLVNDSAYGLEEFIGALDGQIDEMLREVMIRGHQPDPITVQGLGDIFNEDPFYKSHVFRERTGMQASAGSLELQSLCMMVRGHYVQLVWDAEEIRVIYSRDLPELSLAAYIGRDLGQFMDWKPLAGVPSKITETSTSDGVAKITAIRPQPVTVQLGNIEDAAKAA